MQELVQAGLDEKGAVKRCMSENSHFDFNRGTFDNTGDQG